MIININYSYLVVTFRISKIWKIYNIKFKILILVYGLKSSLLSLGLAAKQLASQPCCTLKTINP